MKKILFGFAIIILLCSSSLYAQGLSFSYNANSGDKDLDLSLGNLNLSAGADKDNFITDLSVSYGVPRNKVEAVAIKYKEMTPADIYMIFTLAQLSGQSEEKVLEEYKTNRSKGWGVIAQNLGVKPGSLAFKKLKNGAINLDDKAKVRNKNKAEKNAAKEKGKVQKDKDKGKGK